MILVAILLGAFALVTGAWYIQYFRYFKGLWDVPIPIWVPIFGNLILLSTIKDAYWDLHKYTMTLGKGKIIRGALGFFYGVSIMDPAMLENILSNTAVINKSQTYNFLHRWLGTGLLTSNVEKWRGRRKLLTPAYHFTILEQFIEIFDRNSKILVKKMSEEVGKEQFDVFPHVSLCALDIICETAMGTSVNAQECADSEYVTAINNLALGVLTRTISILKQWDFYYRFTQDYRNEISNLKIVHQYTMSVIQARRANLLYKRNVPIQNEDEAVGTKSKNPFLDVLLQASFNGFPLSDEDIREEVDTFMFEGHDTTRSAISFALYLISKHSLIQTRLVEEQRGIFSADPDRMVTYQDLQEMKYLEMVIKETLRLYPSVPLFARVVSEDFTYDKYRFKKGTQVIIMIYSLHRNPDIYPNPDVFDPERFKPDEQAKRHRFAYLPFSAGYRNCIGQKFAMMEMKTIISMLIRKLVFHATSEEVKLNSTLILSSTTGAKVRISPRLW